MSSKPFLEYLACIKTMENSQFFASGIVFALIQIKYICFTEIIKIIKFTELL